MATLSLWIFFLSLKMLSQKNALGKDCKKGWFGDDCMNACHCVANNCTKSGDCTEGCELGWFGPHCQYIDLAPSGYVTPQVIADGDDDTCIESRGQRFASVVWTTYYLFTWFRIHLKFPGLWHNVTLGFTKFPHSCPMFRCDDKMVNIIDDYSMDIQCSLSNRFSHVWLEGRGVRYLCSFYISGGRNVALKKPLKVNDKEDHLLVDGHRSNGVFNKKICFSSKKRPTNVILKLVPHSATLNRVELHGVESRPIPGLTMFIIDTANKRIQGYRFGNRYQWLHYTLTAKKPWKRVRRIEITGSNDITEFSLCEIEAWGEIDCPSGRYGVKCQEHCKCAVNGEMCATSTGLCPSGCAAGFYGDGCVTKCLPERYGINCAEWCEPQCVGGSCNDRTGACDHGCNMGYKPPRCAETCDEGTYGNCSQVCPKSCLNGICKPDTGECLQCTPYHYGPTCEEKCNPNKFTSSCKGADSLTVHSISIRRTDLLPFRKTFNDFTEGLIIITAIFMAACMLTVFCIFLNKKREFKQHKKVVTFKLS